MTAYRSRADWNARPRRGSTAFPGGRPLGVACHWPGTTTKFTGKSEAAIASALRGWQNYHMDDRGWTDIAYGVAGDPAGRVWQLRGVEVRTAANGGTQPNADYTAYLWILGIGEDPTAAQIQAFRDWRTTRLLKAHPGAKAVKTHNDVRPAPTACPGPDVTKLVRSGTLTRAAAPEEDDDMALPKTRAEALGWFNLFWRGVVPGEDELIGGDELTPAQHIQRASREASEASAASAANAARLAELEEKVDQLLARPGN